MQARSKGFADSHTREKCHSALLYRVRTSEAFAIRVLDNEKWRTLANTQGFTLAHEAVMWHKGAAERAAASYNLASIARASGKKETVAHTIAARWPMDAKRKMTDGRILDLKDAHNITVRQELETKLAAILSKRR